MHRNIVQSDPPEASQLVGNVKSGELRLLLQNM